ncbi:MAG TPA: class I SAM-dependent methyltransferase [Burkholderiales bacterium]|nr:class I SAM-dependent methyltransferase [Burkholderiales bacterium]
MAGRAPLLPEKIARYIHEHSVREPPVLRGLRAATASVPHSGMQIGADQGQFMAILVQLMGAKRCLEIGTYTGYSALAVALALPRDGSIVCCDVSEEWTAVGKPFWKKAGVAKKIDLRIGPALETLKALKGPFDFVFIDADKPNYLNYYECCLKLLRRGGLIAVDNVLWSGEVANPEAKDALTVALREFNERLHKDKRVDLAMLSIGDGVTLALKK